MANDQDEEQEREETLRRMNSAIYTRLFELAVAGGAAPAGLAKRVAESQRRNITIEFDDNGHPIAVAGNHTARFTSDGLTSLARNVFRNASEFTEESARWQERLSKQKGMNPQRVDGLYPAPTQESLREASERHKREMVSKGAGSF